MHADIVKDFEGQSAFTLMNRDVPILECELDTATYVISHIGKVLNPEYLPVGIENNPTHLRRELNNWWENRSIPASRQGIADALNKMRISNRRELLKRSLGLSLSDQYWIRPHGDIIWEEINFFDNDFSEDVGNALFGNDVCHEKFNFSSPDNTSDGWLKKRWKIVDGVRHLVKAGSGTEKQEPINEAFVASELLPSLGADNFVHYDLNIIKGEPFSICPNFITRDTELVTAFHIMNFAKVEPSDSEYEHFLKCCDSLKITGAKEYLDFMLAFDYLIMNTDRHLGNFGAVRDVNTLEFVGMAPLYDNGTSLWSSLGVNDISAFSPFESKPFDKDPIQQIKLASSVDSLNIEALVGSENVFSKLLSMSATISPERRKKLILSWKERVENFERC